MTTELKPLVALFKCYRGGEWFGPSLESVYRHCVGIVAVMAERPWKCSGESADGFPPENCRAPLERFRRDHPGCIISVVRPGVAQDTEEQYRTGLALVKVLYGTDVGVLIVDTDEVWEDDDLTRLRTVMATDRKALYFRSGIWSYRSSPLYRVTPQEAARPVVGLANADVPTGKSRFGNLHQLAAGGQIRDADCQMHHFGYVRLDPEEIISKLANTFGQDGARPRPSWKQIVWDNLPLGQGLHPTRGFEGCWAAVERIAPSLLPAAAVRSTTFWPALAHQRGGVPTELLLNDAPAWRAEAERDTGGLETTTAAGLALCLSAALTSLGARTTQDDCLFLTPRLRMSFRETVQLAAHAATVPAGGRVLEIGSGLGGSLAVLGSAAPAGTDLVAVDPFEPYDEENIVTSRAISVATVDEFRETMDCLRLDCLLHVRSSRDARDVWDRGELDLLLVDGNHSHAHALHDLTAWWPLLKPAGLLLVHDLSGRFPGVVQAAREFEALTGLRFALPDQSTLAWLRKP